MVAPQHRDKSGPKGLHNSLVKERSSGACTSLCQHVFFFHQLLSCFFFDVFNPVFKIIVMVCCVFSWSSSNENLLSWSHSLCVLISSSNLLADFVVTNVFSSSFLHDFVFSFVCVITRSIPC